MQVAWRGATALGSRTLAQEVGPEMAHDIDHLVGQHVPGPDGFRFGAIERGSGGAFRLQIIDANGDEVGWAAGADQHELIADAKRKTAAHVARHDKP